jgi:HD-GYP domain-containing protein (c-di-GMP phosphodiesterase class II)
VSEPLDASQLAIVVTAVALDLALGVVVLERNSRSTTHRYFGAATLTMIIWLVVNFMCDQPMFYDAALVLNRLAIASSLLMGIPLVAFSIVYPRKNARLSWEWWLGLAPLGALAVVTMNTPLVVESVSVESWGTNIAQGPLFPVMAAWGALVVAGIAVMLVRRFRGANPRQRMQYKYLYLGLGLFVGTTLLIGVILPMVTGTNELARLMPLATLLFLLPTGYAIVRHELMDVQLVVLRAATYTATLTGFGILIVLAAQVTHTELAQTLGVSADVFVFLAGLLAVLLFQRVRVLLEHLTDRFFFRRTYDPVEVLNHLGSEMASKIDERELALLLSRELSEHMRLEFAAVAFRSNDRVLTTSSRGVYDGPDLLAWLDANRPATGHVIADDFDTDDTGVRILTDAGVRVLAPLYGDDRLIGAIALGAKRSGVMFSEQDIRFLEVIVPEAAIAMKNAHLFDERDQRVRELTALNQLAFALGSSIELDEMLGSALQQVCTVTAADSGSIMLLNSETQTLSIAASLGVDDEIVASTHIPVGQGVAGWVAERCTPLTLPDDAGHSFANELLREDIVSSICAPVVAKDRVIGVLSVNRREHSELFAEENLHVVTSFAGQLGIAIENARLYADLEKTFLGTIGALAAAVDAKDPYTFGHSNEVTIHAVAIAEHLGLGDDEVDMIRIAATLHDIGKIGIDGAILLKPGALTPEEREIINQHPAIGADILAPLDFLRDTVPYILFHHERYGGGGYPTGISGDAIPFGARIIAVADSFNAMVSDRPYRKGLALEAAMEEIRSNAGSQFDPDVAKAFLELLEAEPRGSAGSVPTQSPITTAARQ